MGCLQPPPDERKFACVYIGRPVRPFLVIDMSQQATGTFDVKLNPLDLAEAGEGDTRARMSINKRFHGDLETTSTGEMLSAMTAIQGSAGYVAMERVVGTLQGQSGSFVLQHSGTMNRGEPSLAVAVVPDSGTGQLQGLAGTLAISIREGTHYYTFDFRLTGEP